MRRELFSRRYVGITLLIFVAAAQVIIIALLSESTPPTREVRQPAEEPPQRFATTSFRNSQGGYEFSHPPSWEATRKGSISQLVTPGHDVIVSFGRGPRGEMFDSSLELVDLIRAEYRRIQVDDTDANQISGMSALASTGTGVNDSGFKVRWQAVTIEGPRRNFAVTVFTTAERKPDTSLQIAEVLESFRVGGN
jgi:hypothetical protein